MRKKEKVRNKNFKTVKDKLEFIQKECPETELFEDLKQLFKNKDFDNVRITHGTDEFGKDLIFSKFDNVFAEDKWFAVIVKNKNATQNDFLQKNEIGNQIDLATTIPYENTKGEKINISGLFVVINGTVSRNAKEVISKYVTPVILSNIKIWDYQDIEREIDKFSKECFLDNMEPTLNIFVTEQTKSLSDISFTNSVYDLNINDINEIFINVQTTFSKELKKINNYISFEKEDPKIKDEDIEGSNEILNSDKNFIIHGIPTSGKTLFLKRIGLKALGKNLIKPSAIFFIDLLNIKPEKFDIKELINSQFSSLTKGEVFNQEDYSKTILLIDSIDFINEDSDKLKIYSIIEKYISESSKLKIQVVIATRNIEFIKNNNKLVDFDETELLPFNFNQAFRLVKKIIPNNDIKANNFIKAIKSSLLDSSLQRTPLALTLMAILYRDDKVDLKELPANIYELYNKFTDIYLERWDTSKGVTQQYKYEQTKNILAFISFHLHNSGKNSISEVELKEYLKGLRLRFNYEELKNIDSFVAHLQSKNGVFNYDSVNKSFYFFNHYFQEFFASLCIEDDDDTILIDNFFNEWWSNALVFYCGKKPKSFKIHKELNKTIIPNKSFQKYFYINLHSKCLQASHSISIESREIIVKKILFEFDNHYKSIITEGQNEDNSFLKAIPFVNVLSQSKNTFETVFSSKFIATSEIVDLFKHILENESHFSNITLYNISYFLAFHNNNALPFENFESKIENDIVWNRILYVDINFLKLKNKIDNKKYLRIKRKMSKNKFQIQDILRKSFVEKDLILPNA